MARGRKGTAAYITFTCNLDGCDKTRTELLSQHKMFRKHYCSNECKHKVGRSITIPMRDNCKKCKKPMEEDDEYLSTCNEYACYCKDCRLLKKWKDVAEKTLRQREFVDKFNGLYYE